MHLVAYPEVDESPIEPTVRAARDCRAGAARHPRGAADGGLGGADGADGADGAGERANGRTRQSVNYHVKALHRAGLLVEAATRRRGNFIEQLYRAAAHRFIVAPEATSSPERLAAAFAEQAALSYLASFGERVAQDALALAGQASAGSGEVPSATAESEIRFADEEARSAFLGAYVVMLEELASQHGSPDGVPFQPAVHCAHKQSRSQGSRHRTGQAQPRRRRRCSARCCALSAIVPRARRRARRCTLTPGDTRPGSTHASDQPSRGC